MQPELSGESTPEQPRGGLRLFGVPIRFHLTFILFLAFLLFIGVGRRTSGLAGFFYILTLFGSVLLHELGHALVARRYGIKTVEIVMYPIGGLARLERQPKAAEELWIALAGPAVNLVIAALLFGALWIQSQRMQMDNLGEPTDSNLLHRLMVGNLVLALFNLLPAFPMDGGRVLRAWLARSRSEERATQMAASTGKVLAFLMGLFGLLNGQFMLVFIAFFVYAGASQESAVAMGKQLTQGIPTRLAMVTDFRTLAHGDTIGRAAQLLLETSQQDFPVLVGDQVAGLLNRTALLRAMASTGSDGYVAGAMDRNYTRVQPETELTEAMTAMSQSGTCALVMDTQDRLVGLLTSENVTEFLLLRRMGMPPKTLEAV